MIGLRRLARDTSGTSAAEFGLVLPVFLLLLFGIMDAGGYAWAFNKAEKATQMGARWAAVTDMVPSGVANHSFAVAGTVPQGNTVPTSAFNKVSCVSTAADGATVTCTFDPGSLPSTTSPAAFRKIVETMRRVKSDIGYTNVQVVYQNSGLGFSGDPNGPDVAPLITVRLVNMRYRPFTLMMFRGTVPLPATTYSITMEDGQGTTGYF